MRLKNGYELKYLSGKYCVTYNGKVTGDMDNSIVLSDTAVFLWNLLKKREVTKAQMLIEVLKNFNISTVSAAGNVDVFVRTMKEYGIIE